MTTMEWARFALTGDSASSTLTTGQLMPLIDSFKRRAVKLNPCIGPDPETDLTGDDLEYWHEWSGRWVAEEFKGTPAGQVFLTGNDGKGAILEKEADGVRVRYSGPGKSSIVTSPDAFMPSNRELALIAKGSITCIAAAMELYVPPSESLVELAGRRRVLDAAYHAETGTEHCPEFEVIEHGIF